MGHTDNQDAIALLLELEGRARRCAAGLPQEEEVKSTWIGISFRVGDGHFVTPLEEVAEILTYPTLSRVPGTKPWVKGIANIRGNLLPVMDLKGYLSTTPTALSASSRVLVVDHSGVFSGLLVDEVMGLRHFLEEERRRELPATDGFVKSYLQGSFDRDGQRWGIFSLHALASSSVFMQVAV